MLIDCIKDISFKISSSAQGKRKIVECFGTPGVGKTYVSNQLSDAFRKDAINFSRLPIDLASFSRVRRILFKIWLIFYLVLFERKIVSIVNSLVNAYRLNHLGHRIKLFFNWLYLCAIIRSESQAFEVVLLDQGIGQALWSNSYYGRLVISYDEVSSLLDELLVILSIDSLFVLHVGADSNKIESRLLSREKGNSPLDKKGTQFLQRGTNITDQTLFVLNNLERKCSALEVVNVDNNF
jgi:Cdc6-like AAA superfamily ATPase